MIQHQSRQWSLKGQQTERVQNEQNDHEVVKRLVHFIHEAIISHSRSVDQQTRRCGADQRDRNPENQRLAYTQMTPPSAEPEPCEIGVETIEAKLAGVQQHPKQAQCDNRRHAVTQNILHDPEIARDEGKDGQRRKVDVKDTDVLLQTHRATPSAGQTRTCSV